MISAAEYLAWLADGPDADLLDIGTVIGIPECPGCGLQSWSIPIRYCTASCKARHHNLLHYERKRAYAREYKQRTREP